MSADGHPQDDDLPHDAMLRAALRHAPDRDMLPPEPVRRAILAAAREAAAPARRHRVAAVLTALGELLRQPAATAAFASLMLGTLIVILWQDGPPPAPERHAALGAAQRQAPTIDAAAVAANEAAAATAAAGARAMAETEATRRDSALAAGRAPREPGSERLAKPSTASAPGPAVAARRRMPVETSAPAGSSPLESATAVAAAPQPAPASPPPAMAAAQGRLADAAAPEADPLGPVLAALGAPRSEAVALERRAMAAPQAGAATATVAKSAAAEEHPQQRADADPAAWLRELRAGARGRWQRVDAVALPDAREVQAAGGTLLGRIAIVDGDAVLWQPADSPGMAWRATLGPEALARLRAALAPARR